MLEPTTLQIPYTNAPFLFATSIAASVSAVSPLCDIAMTTSFSVTTGFEYLNSLAYSTVTGMRQKFSIRYLPISPACHEVPQATIIIRFAFNIAIIIVYPPTHAILNTLRLFKYLLQHKVRETSLLYLTKI